jgi:membrane protease YdiL (CAAX protease family)
MLFPDIRAWRTTPCREGQQMGDRIERVEMNTRLVTPQGTRAVGAPHLQVPVGERVVGARRFPSQFGHRLVPTLRRHPLIGYFVLAYGFSWFVMIVLAVLGLPAAVVVALFTVGPAFAAVTMTALLDGRPGLGRLLRRLTLWRVGIRWYLVALLGIPLVYLLATLAMPGARAGFRSALPVPWIVEYLIVLTAGGIIGGPFFEEPGWRGFALPRMQARFGPLRATLLLGVLWGAWHLPQYFVPAWADQNGGAHPESIAVYLLTVMAIATIMTWVFNCTQGSLLLAMLAHASVNAAQVMVVNRLFPSMASSEVNALLGFGVAALALIVATRGRLGYRGAEASEGGFSTK